ncbi:37S ribosomal protein subunit S8,mitochondrial [Taphrina deformans PYCC 5710]|uniref:Small ribosomal subunit protein uS8m n=1 Tax=Taphrina deformans (strain PYCC 5710 / ATCC 11124 / CBS 356.35 / IMI 108563 / JCM 9778 / NBRC 8474) TaxID=1097556 RepID=R4XC45_TAPDE|nr:37S ribosomal protein subunit S8,mitochondrial [Taphrina deformans PYCC 5710]|eukprot:CCG80910.1 37S ribosomal protein subunit S8,mitochondrial [Taphrina deformans PYCC 5710]
MPLHHVASHLQNASRARSSITSIPLSKMNLSIVLGLYRQGFLSSVQRGSINGPDVEYTPTTPENISTRRIWLGLKYRDASPVLSNMHVISKPSRKIWMSVSELKQLVNGQKGREMIKGLVPGEICFVGTDKGVMEIRDAIKRRIGGEVLVRVD